MGTPHDHAKHRGGAPVKASKVTNGSSSPAPCLEQDLMCTLVASSRTKRKERG